MRIDWVELADIKDQAAKAGVIGWQVYMYDWCHKQREEGICRVIVTIDGVNKYDYTKAEAYNDMRKPNEYLTTD